MHLFCIKHCDKTHPQFSSLVPRKKASPRDKPQRVRGPAIQWSAETLFNTADEAKAYITRDNKWKFRYSHQTTEGKKVNQGTNLPKLDILYIKHFTLHISEYTNVLYILLYDIQCTSIRVNLCC